MAIKYVFFLFPILFFNIIKSYVISGNSNIINIPKYTYKTSNNDIHNVFNKNIIEATIFNNKKYYEDTITSNSFNFNIYCKDHEEVCKLYTNELDSVTKRISSTFEIYSPITVDLYVVNLTSACFDCMGLSVQPNFVPLRESKDTENPIYVFPQSLVRQLKLNKKVDMIDTDFSIILNSIIPENVNVTMVSHFILTHEIMHGLGFIGTSGLANFHLPYDWALFKDDILIPQETFTTEILENNQLKYTYTGFYPLSIFEKYIVQRNNSDHYLLEEMTDIYKIPLEEPKQYVSNGNDLNNEYINLFTNFYQNIVLGDRYEKAKEIANIYKTEKAIGFKTNHGDIIPLQTFDYIFSSTSSIFHTELTKVDTLKFFNVDPFNKSAIATYLDENFLMNYSLFFLDDMDTIVSIVGEDNKHGLIGPGIVDIMKTIGWTEKGHSSNDKTYYVTDDFHLKFNSNIDYLFNSYSNHKTKL